MQQNNVLKIIVGIVVVLVVVLGGYMLLSGGSDDAGFGFNNGPASNKPIKIGLSAPMTGEAASWGQNALAGAELAVKEINEKGGVIGRQIELVTEDDKCDSAVGVSAMNKLINVDKVDLMAGPLCSAAAGASLPIVQKAGIPSIIIASAPKLVQTGDYIFRIYPSDALAGKTGAEFIFNNLNKRKAALIYVKNDYGEGLKDSFTKRFTELGGEIVLNEGVQQDAVDLRTQIAKIKNSGAEAVYFPVYPKNAVAGLKQMRDMKLALQVVGADSLSGEEVLKEPAAEGIIYSVANFNNPEPFQAKIKQLPGREKLEVSFVAAMGYDLVKSLVAAIEKAQIMDSVKVRDALFSVRYGGAMSMPVIEFDSAREIKNPMANIVVVKNGKAVPYNQ